MYPQKRQHLTCPTLQKKEHQARQLLNPLYWIRFRPMIRSSSKFFQLEQETRPEAVSPEVIPTRNMNLDPSSPPQLTLHVHACIYF